MLSPRLLELLEEWWLIGQPHDMAVSGPRSAAADHDAPALSGRHRDRASGRDREAGVAAHAAAQLRDPSLGAGCRYSSDPGGSRAFQARYDGALCARREQGAARHGEPARSARAVSTAEKDSRRSSRRRQCPVQLWRSRTSSATTVPLGVEANARPREPRPAEGDERDRALPHGGARRARCALREPACAHTTIAYNSCRNRHCPKCQGAAAREWLESAQGRAAAGAVLPRRVHAAGRGSATSPTRTRRVIYDLLFKASAETMLTIAADPKHLGARIGITSVLHTFYGAFLVKPAASNSFHFTSFIPFSCSTPPEAFFSSRPRAACAVARRACQGWPLFGGHPGASPGLGLDTPEPDGIMDAFGVGLRACSPLDCDHSAMLGRSGLCDLACPILRSFRDDGSEVGARM